MAQDKSLLILDDEGNTEEVYRAEQMLHEPFVIGPRPRELLIPPRTDPAATTGRLIVADVHHGRNMAGVQPGEIKRLLVLEQPPKPVNFSGVQQTLSMNGSFTLKRILGTVPVEPDGSAYFEEPALRSLYFVALDEQGRTVKRMQSFCSVLPGETTSCVGCHEQRIETPRFARTLRATTRAPSRIEPIAYERLAVDPAPRLVLVDLQLPNISGHEITWEMWFNLDGSRIIIIAPDQKTAAIYQNKDGVDHVLINPFSLDELTRIVRPYTNPGYKG